MMTSQELRTSPLFENISYEDYRRMLTCFQAVQRSYSCREENRSIRLSARGRSRARMLSASWSAAARP